MKSFCPDCPNPNRCNVSNDCMGADPSDYRPAPVEYVQSNGAPVLPGDSAARKATPIASGVLDYFPLALAAVARHSKRSNEKHNPGEPMHWSRGKSDDHADCIIRHLIDRGTIDPDSGELHDVALAWRALAQLQIAEEKRLSRGVG